MANWITRKPNPDEKQREAVQGEFFSAETITSEAQALVREGIQNSLDAAVVDSVTHRKKPRVRIYTSGAQGALSWSKASRFFEDAWPHFEAADSGLIRSEVPSRRTPCPFLVFEDFGTSGLTGDMTRNVQPPKGKENAFYYYLRAEGQSGKTGSDRGRWGIGKFVFPRASRVRTFMALTTRADDGRTVVTGQFILKWHTVGGETYSPDGWFGAQDSSGVLLPASDEVLIDDFRSRFRLSRSDEPGLSLVVPWCRSEIDLSLLVQCVLSDFYYPILRGELEVEVADSNEAVTISQETFDEIYHAHRKHLTSDEAGTIELAREATAARGLTVFRASAPESKEPAWADDTLDEDTTAGIRRLLDEGELASIRVPLWVHKVEGDSERAEIQVWLKRDDTATLGRPVFIREGLVIPAAHSVLSRGFRALVLIEDRPIARLLGDAENPSHTKWDAKSEHFQGKYHARKGAAAITFVRTVVSKIVDTVTKGGAETDLTTLARLFKARQQQEGKGKKPTRGERPRIAKPVLPPDRPLKLWEQSKLTGKSGFAVYSSGVEVVPAKILTVGVGYDVTRGNPLRRWSEFDFTLGGKGSVDVTWTGAGIDTSSIRVEGNRFSARITNNDFRIEFTGFDPHRDVYMEARMRDAS